MSYKNDSLLVIMNNYGKADADAKAELFETYDKLRDLTVSGSTIGAGAGYGAVGNVFMNIANLFAPSSFAPTMGGQSMNIPGTSYTSTTYGNSQVISGNQGSFGYGNLGNYSGFPTGGAAGLVGAGTAASALIGAGSAATGSATSSWVLPIASFLGGIGGIATSIGPYLGPYGAAATIGGNMLNGFAGAALSSFQNIQGRVVNNADTLLTNKVHNIETVCKELEAQSDVVKKMLKDSIDGDSKAIQNI